MAKEEKATKENPIIETVKTVVYALLLAGLFRTVFSTVLDTLRINEKYVAYQGFFFLLIRWPMGIPMLLAQHSVYKYHA